MTSEVLGKYWLAAKIESVDRTVIPDDKIIQNLYPCLSMLFPTQLPVRTIPHEDVKNKRLKSTELACRSSVNHLAKYTPPITAGMECAKSNRHQPNNELLLISTSSITVNSLSSSKTFVKG